MIYLFLAFQIKHLLADWLIQPRYMHQNKGTFGHAGGILHSGLHGILTFFILLLITPYAGLIAPAEALAHYMIDWSKMNINKKLGFVPIPSGPYKWPQSEYFWMAVGVDQFLHQLCYIAIIALVS